MNESLRWSVTPSNARRQTPVSAPPWQPEPLIMPEEPQRGMIALIGLPGSGKSTIGRQLARRLQRPLVNPVTPSCSVTVALYPPMLQAGEGEDRFRAVEASVADELTDCSSDAPCAR